LQEAQQYINSIELSTPPDDPSISACGDDGPENQKVGFMFIYVMFEVQANKAPGNIRPAEP
jgi:hypothetical protein